MRVMSILSWVTLSLALTACASGPISRSDAVGFEESGGASYYAMKYQGRKTASGELFVSVR